MATLYEHYEQWEKLKSDAVVAKCKELQNEMYSKLPSVTPVRKNPIKTHIVAHRYNGIPAVRKNVSAEEQPGQMKSGWAKATVTLGGKKVYAVRNRARPTVVHLLNFDRRHYSHGKPSRAGVLPGSSFVTKVQEEANAKLNSEIKKIFEKE